MDETTKKAVISQAVKAITEMSIAKLPDGLKKKRDENHPGVHHIHVDGEHVASITGYKPDRSRWGTRDGNGAFKGYDTEHGKHYAIHAPGHVWSTRDNDTGNINPHEHPDHHDKVKETEDGKEYTVIRPHTYGSMDSAIEAIHAAHENNKEFGRGHDPRKRWEKAIYSVGSNEQHAATAAKYQQAHRALTKLGHHDLASTLHDHMDAHKATSGFVGSKDDLKRWTHDAKSYTGLHYKVDSEGKKIKNKDYHSAGSYHLLEPDHPEHHELANKAHEIHMKARRGW